MKVPPGKLSVHPDIMGQKYCPECKQVVITKALNNYSQIDFKGVQGKRRKIAHLEEDGGCGHIWVTVEIVEDVLVT
jgi:hypothetical protein